MFSIEPGPCREAGKGGKGVHGNGGGGSAHHREALWLLALEAAGVAVQACQETLQPDLEETRRPDLEGNPGDMDGSLVSIVTLSAL